MCIIKWLKPIECSDFLVTLVVASNSAPEIRLFEHWKNQAQAIQIFWLWALTYHQ